MQTRSKSGQPHAAAGVWPTSHNSGQQLAAKSSTSLDVVFERSTTLYTSAGRHGRIAGGVVCRCCFCCFCEGKELQQASSQTSATLRIRQFERPAAPRGQRTIPTIGWCQVCSTYTWYSYMARTNFTPSTCDLARDALLPPS